MQDVTASLTPDVHARLGAHADDHARAVRSMFDRISPRYDLLNRLLSLGIDRSWREEAIRQLLDRLPRGPVGDLCAGTLDLSRSLERALAPDTRPLLSLDFSAEMLIRGQAKVSTRTRLVVGDSMALPLASGSMAGLVCGFGFRNLADPVQGLREAFRCLKPGGSLVVLEFFRPARLDTKLFHRIYASVVLPTVGSVVSGDQRAYKYLAASMEGFLSQAEFAKAMTDVGFRSVRAVDLTLGVASILRGNKPYEVETSTGPNENELDAEAVLACPNCHNGFRREAHGVRICDGCALRFSEQGGVLNLIVSDAERMPSLPTIHS